MRGEQSIPGGLYLTAEGDCGTLRLPPSLHLWLWDHLLLWSPPRMSVYTDKFDSPSKHS